MYQEELFQLIQNIQKILWGLGQRGCLRQYNSFDKVFNPKEQRNKVIEKHFNVIRLLIFTITIIVQTIIQIGFSNVSFLRTLCITMSSFYLKGTFSNFRNSPRLQLQLCVFDSLPTCLSVLWTVVLVFKGYYVYVQDKLPSTNLTSARPEVKNAIKV